MKSTTSAKQAAPQAQLDVTALTQALAAPFDPREVRFKPAVVSGNRALALAYVDARSIQDRLDEVLGVEGWQDNYKCLTDGSVVCRLRLRLGNEWVTKVDVGGPSEQPDGGDRLKAAFSDALKRAAVKFGIGRYLYRLPAQWVDYDPQKRQFVRPPVLAAFALPAKEPPAPVLKVPADPKPAKEPAAPPPPKESPTPRKPARKPAAHSLPTNGVELQRRLYEYDARLAAQGLCQRGDLVKHVVAAGTKAGYDSDLATWTGPAMELAVEETKRFETQARQNQIQHKDVA
jgi:hypothetical protein